MTDITIGVLVIAGVVVVALAILRLRHISFPSLMLSLAGAIFGLLLGALASVPLSKLPSPFGAIMPLAVTTILTLILIGAAVSRRRTLSAQFAWLREPDQQPAAATESAPGAEAPTQASPQPQPGMLPPILVDTSVIIDGRIADIAAAGFIPGRLVVPRFVLAELQNIADSDDAMRRGRGRRGLDVLNTLRDQPGVGIEITEQDVSGIREVDAKLVALAQKLTCDVLTTDYNLNRVAQIQGVRVLNVNELSNAIRPVVLPGEELVVRVVQPGKERNQGVGYLADGTMIVVENGDKLIGQEVATEVTRVFQTVAGKMIFATPRKGSLPPTDGGQSESAPNAETITPAPNPQDKPRHHDQSTNTERNDHRIANRPNRNRKHSPNQFNANNSGNSGPNPAPRPSANLEDRVIAAANHSNGASEQRRQPNQN